MTISVQRAVIAFCISWSCPVVAGELTVEQLVVAYRASFEAASTVECSYKTYFKSIVDLGATRDSGSPGWGLYSDWAWAWDRNTGRENLVGLWGFQKDDAFVYHKHRLAFDGEQLRTISYADLGGRIAEVGDTFLEWRSPFYLAGRGIAEIPYRDLCELLEDNARLVPEESTQEMPMLMSEFKTGTEPRVLKVQLDASAGYMPRFIEISMPYPIDVVRRRCIVDRIAQVVPGVWFPMEGRVTMYSLVTPDEFPGGLSLPQFDDKLKSLESDEKRNALIAEVVFASKELGFGEQRYVVSEDSLRVNRQLDEEMFTFEFPTGTGVYDSFKGTGYWVGNDEANIAPLAVYRIPLALIAASILAFVAWRFRRVLSLGK